MPQSADQPLVLLGDDGSSLTVARNPDPDWPYIIVVDQGRDILLSPGDAAAVAAFLARRPPVTERTTT
jgi:hypothetical protein